MLICTGIAFESTPTEKITKLQVFLQLKSSACRIEVSHEYFTEAELAKADIELIHKLFENIKWRVDRLSVVGDLEIENVTELLDKLDAKLLLSTVRQNETYSIIEPNSW